LSHTEEVYPLQYATDGSLLENLKFALKNEALDLRIIFSTLKAIGKSGLEEWIRREPTGAYSRRAWFLYEFFSSDTLAVPDCLSGNYVDALNAERHYVAEPINSRRHRVRDNLLGTADLCPTVRRSPKLKSMVEWDLSAETRKIAQLYSKETVARVVSFLYTKETRSSFAIEGESPSSNREERFLQSLRAAPTFLPADENKLVELQGRIVDPRYAAENWRRLQNFVGETTRNFGQHVHFICPKPEDVPGLMKGWMEMTDRLLHSSVDPVVAATLNAFSFVFIHPFEDGNGRIHRFLVHAFLASRQFGPPGMILPISAAILRQRAQYDKVLEQFSQPIMTAIDWDFSGDAIRVKNETRDLYRFYDATHQAEFLYEKLAEAIRTDFKEEADFLEVFDAALEAVRTIVDMPDKRASLIVRCCLEQGRLSKSKRGQFKELSNLELDSIETQIQGIIQAHREPKTEELSS
jgi:Fic family protein